MYCYERFEKYENFYEGHFDQYHDEWKISE